MDRGAACGGVLGRGAVAGVGLVVALALVMLTGCSVDIRAAGDFSPGHRDTLTVATAEIPLVGMWTGTAARPDGGFEYGLAQALRDRFGLSRLKVLVIPFSRLVHGHLGGADLAIADITPTSERDAVLDFTVPYLAATPAVLVRAGETVSDLAGARRLSWAVGRSTTLEDFIDSTIRPAEPTLLTSSQTETVAAVEHRRVDAGLLDLPVAAAVASASGGTLSVAGQFASNDDVSVALPEGSDNVEAVDSAVRAFIADGTIADLADRWLGLQLNGTSAVQVPLIRTEAR